MPQYVIETFVVRRFRRADDGPLQPYVGAILTQRGFRLRGGRWIESRLAGREEFDSVWGMDMRGKEAGQGEG